MDRRKARDASVMRPERRSKVQGSFGAIVDLNAGKPAPAPLVDPKRSFKGKPGRINLKAVAEVLADRGLDPTEAIVDILRPIDPETGEPVASKLDPEVQARILNELLQYTQPKLKSSEVKAKVAATAFDINDEQARRIAEEFLKQGEMDG